MLPTTNVSHQPQNLPTQTAIPSHHPREEEGVAGPASKRPKVETSAVDSQPSATLQAPQTSSIPAQAPANVQKMIENPEWFSAAKQQDNQLDIKFLVNVFGDLFAKGTSYEGLKQDPIVSYVNKFLKNLDDEKCAVIFGKSQEDVRSIKNCLIRLLDSYEEISLCMKKQDNEKLAQTADRLRRKIAECLNRSGQCLIPGGYEGKPDGHAMYYRVYLAQDNKIWVSVYNRGESCDNVVKEQIIDGKSYLVSGIEFGPFEQVEFFDEIMMRRLVEYHNFSDKNYTAKEVYESLFLDFSHTTAPKLPKNASTPQHSGTCAWKSFLPVLQSFTNQNQFQRLRFFLKSHIILEYISKKGVGIEYPSAEYEACLKSLEGFIHAVENASAYKIISLDVVDFLVKEVENFKRDHLQPKVEKYLEDVPKEKVLSLDNINDFSHSFTKGGIESSLVKNKGRCNIRAEQTQLEVFTKSTFNAENILEKIEATFDNVEYLEPKRFQDQFYSLIDALPFPSVGFDESDIWQKIAREDSEKALDLIKAIGKFVHHFSVTLYVSQDENKFREDFLIDPEIIVSLYKTITIVDSLLVNSDPTVVKMYGIDPLPDYRFLSALLGKPIRSVLLPSDYKWPRQFCLDKFTGSQYADLLHMYNYLEERAARRDPNIPFAFENSGTESPWVSTIKFEKEMLNGASGKRVNPEIKFVLDILDDEDRLAEFEFEENEMLDGYFIALDEGSKIYQFFTVFYSGETLQESYPAYLYWRLINVVSKTAFSVDVIPDQFPYYVDDEAVSASLSCIPAAAKVDQADEVYMHLIGPYQGMQQSVFKSRQNPKIEECLGNIGGSGFLALSPDEKFSLKNWGFSDGVLKDVVTYIKNHPDLSEGQIVFLTHEDLNIDSDFPLDELHQLLKLLITPSLKVEELLVYFRNHTNRLKDPDFVKVFYNLFYSSAVSFSNLYSKDFELLINFINEGYRSSKAIQDVELLHLYLDLMIQFRNICKQTGLNVDDYIREKNVFDPLEGIYFIKNHTTLKTENWIRYVHELAMSDDRKEVKHLLFEAVLLKNYTDLILSKKSILFADRVCLEQFNEDPKILLDHLIPKNWEIYNQINQKQWKFNYPIIESLDEKIVVDFKNGIVTVDGYSITTLPISYLNKLPPYLYSKEVVKAIDRSSYEFISEKWGKVQTFITNKKKIISISPKGENATFRLVESPDFDDRILNLIKDCTVWLEQENQASGFILDPQGKVVYTLSSTPNTISVYKTVDDVKYVCLNFDQNSFGQFFKRLDSNALLLGHLDSNKPQVIELPSLALQFNWNSSNNKWECKQRAGFSVSNNQCMAPLEQIGISQYLILENEKGKREIIIPRFHDHERKSSSGYCVYELSETAMHKEKILSGVNAEADIYLSLLALESRSSDGYAIAHSLLKPHKLNTQNPTDISKKLLLRIFNLQDKLADIHPRSLVCRLMAFYIYTEMFEPAPFNKNSFQEITASTWENFTDDIIYYSECCKRLGCYDLEHSEKNELRRVWNFAINNNRIQYEKRKNFIPFSPTTQVDNEVSVLESDESSLILSGTYESEYLRTVLKEALDNFRDLDWQDLSFTRPEKALVAVFLQCVLTGNYLKSGTVDNKFIRKVVSASRFDKNQTARLFCRFLYNLLNLSDSDDIKYVNELINGIRNKYRTEGNTESVVELLRELISNMLPEAVKFESITPKVYDLKLNERRRSTTKPIPNFSTRAEGLIVRDVAMTEDMELDITDSNTKIGHLERYIEKRSEEGVEDRMIMTHLKGTLEKFFDSYKEAGLYGKKLGRLRADYQYYIETEVQKSPVNKQFKDSEIENLYNTISNVIKNRRVVEKQKEDALPKTMVFGPEAQLKSLLLSNKTSKVSILDLLILYGRTKPIQNEPNSPREKMFSQVGEYLLFANETKQLIRVQKMLGEWLVTPEGEIEKRKQLKHAAFNEFLSRSVSPDRAIQVIEFLINNKVRRDQIEFLNTLVTGKGGVLSQASPGFGKTYLIMPLYAILLKRRDVLPMIIVPDELLPWITDTLRKSLGTVYNTYLKSLNFDLKRELSKEDVESICDILKVAKQNGQVIIVGASYIHNIVIQIEKTILTACNETRENPSTKEEVDAVFKLHKFLQKECMPLGEEVHQQMNVRNETNRPFGDSTNLPYMERIGLMMLYDVLLNSPEISSLVRFDFDVNNQNEKAVPFTTELYQTVIKEKLVDCILDKLQNPYVIGEEGKNTIHEYFTSLDSEQVELLRTFLLNRRSDAQKYQSACDFVARIKQTNISNLIHLFAEEIDRLLESTLKLKCDESYALKGTFAVPAKNGEILEGSIFGIPHETGNLTIQAALKHGISKHDVIKGVEYCQNMIREEAQKGMLDIKKSKGYLDFIALSPKNANRNIFNLSDEDYENITKEISDDRKLLNQFVFNIFLPSIKFYLSKVNSNSFSLGYLFPNMRGMSGTISPDYVYPEGFEVKLNKGTDGRSLYVMLKNALSVVDGQIIESPTISVVSKEGPEELLAVVQNLVSENVPVRLVTDAAGYLNGVSHDIFMRDWLPSITKKDSSLQAVCYHKQGRINVYEAGKNTPEILEDSKVKPENRLTVLFQPYVTGTHTEQAKDAVEVLTIGKNTTLTLLIQALWRARQIHLQQKFRLVMSEDVVQIIQIKLGLDSSQKISLEHVILFVLQNEAKEESEENALGIKLKTKAFLKNEILRICQLAIENKESYNDLLIPETAELFAVKSEREARLAYPGQSEKENSVTVLKNYQESLYAQFMVIWNKSPTLQKYSDKDGVRNKLESFIIPDIIPEELDIHPNTTPGTTQVVQVTENQTMQVKKSMQNQKMNAQECQRKASELYKWDWIPSDGVIPTAKFLHEFIIRSQNPLVQETVAIWQSTDKAWLTISHNLSGRDSGANQGWDKIAGDLEDYSPVPFDKYSKECNYIMLIKAPEGQRVVMLDLKDAEECKKKFEEGVYNEYGQVYISLYELTLGELFNNQGKEFDVETDEIFAMMIAKVKFYNGRVDYTPLQTQKLLEWMDQYGKDQMLELFEQVLINNKSDKKELIRKMRSLTDI